MTRFPRFTLAAALLALVACAPKQDDPRSTMDSAPAANTQPAAAGALPVAAPTPAPVAAPAPAPAPVPAPTPAAQPGSGETPGKWQQFWLDRVNGFIAENATLPAGRRNIVFLGDSLTQGFKLNTFFPGLPVLNRGIVSDGVADFPNGKNPWRGVNQRLKESVFDCNPSHVFFTIGTNDVGSGIGMDYWFKEYTEVLDKIRAWFPDVKIVIMTCPPSGPPYKRVETLNPKIVEWNTRIREYAKTQNFRVIDLHALLASPEGVLPPDLTRDGLHFNQTGYERWAEKVKEILREDGAMPAAN